LPFKRDLIGLSLSLSLLFLVHFNPLGASVRVEGPPLGAGPFKFKVLQGHSGPLWATKLAAWHSSRVPRGPLDWPYSTLKVKETWLYNH
jgi:hypothetical protein